MRVLAADDDPAMARVLERSLRSWGYEAIVAHEGTEAWKHLKHAGAPRIAILDWDMPGLSGLEVCRLLRSTPHGADVYVLMLTGRQEKNDVVAALESGADDFLSKPFHPRELQLRLAKGVRDSAGARSTRGSAAVASPPPTGTTLGGKYRLEKQIAQGGMGTVWLGVHLSLGINVAIKFMDAKLAETADYASFEREARAAAQLRNEHSVRVYDHGIGPTGLPYLVMEYLAGESILARLDRKGTLTPAEVVACVDQVARALGEAHARGLVHRDIKPENILLIEDVDRPLGFSAKLIDFGLANPSAGGGRPERGPTAGTPSYMSPECLQAEAGATPALDLWGLAATTFVAITGAIPFDGESLTQIYDRVCTEALPVPSHTADVPPGFDAWFARACARDPRARFGSAAELASALANACTMKASSVVGLAPEHASTSAPMLPTEPDSGRAIAALAIARAATTDRSRE
jgi:serine/threonine protein kinase